MRNLKSMQSVFTMALALSLPVSLGACAVASPPTSANPLPKLASVQQQYESNLLAAKAPVAPKEMFTVDAQPESTAPDDKTLIMNKLQQLEAEMQTLKARLQESNVATSDTQKKLAAVSRNSAFQGKTLDSLMQRARLSGYSEFGWRAYDNAPRTSEYLGANGEDRNSFDIRRFVLRANTQFTEKASWIGEVEFEDAGLDSIQVEQSEFLYNVAPWLNLRAGLLIPTLSVVNVNHEGTSRLLVDRPMIDYYVIPSTYRDLGVGITGFVPVLKQSAINYELNLLQGFTDVVSSNGANPISDSPSYTGLRNARPNRTANSSNFLDNNDNKALHARVGFVPFPGLEVGAGGYFSKYDAGNNKNLSILTGDLRYRRKRWSAMGEYAQVMYERGAGANRSGVLFNNYPQGLGGYHLEVGYDVTPKLTAVAAWQQVDLDTGRNGSTLSRASIGSRYNLFSRVYLKGEYQYNIFSEVQTKDTSHALLTQLTFDF